MKQKKKLKIDLAQSSKPNGCWDDNDSGVDDNDDWNNKTDIYQTLHSKAVDVANEDAPAVFGSWDHQIKCEYTTYINFCLLTYQSCDLLVSK